jgi:ABC-2 type transport system permease protein
VGSILRILAFVRKETIEVLRQPRLLFALVLGPFAILLLFGAGYREEAQPRRTLFVAPDENGMHQAVEEHAQELGPILDYAGVTSDENDARWQLARGEVEVVVIVPADMQGPTTGQEQANVVVLHNEINPIQVGYLERFAQSYVDDVNRQVLRGVAEDAQGDAAEAQTEVSQARRSAAALRLALDSGDRAGAQRQGSEVDRQLETLQQALGATAGFLSPEDLAGAGGTAAREGDATAAGRLEQQLAELEENLQTFREADPGVIVRPFTSEVRSVRGETPNVTDFFAPSVIVVLLQHLAVTVAALSIVRERRLGAMELFRVSPLGALELLIGKYLSFLIFGAFVGAALTALIHWGLGVEVLGDWLLYVAVLGGVIFASLGIGFVASLFSQTDSQAVQYTMIVLLLAVFFSGFLVILTSIIMPVRLVSWVIPATYGIALLQDVMLRGAFPRPELLAVLYAGGALLFAVTWVLLRREMRVGR